jgi:hypothetical protein
MPITHRGEAFRTSAIGQTPEGPGVFECLCNGNTIYIGWAGREGIRQKLREHYSGKYGSCTQISTGFTCEEHEDPEARCKELLEEYKSEHGKAPRGNM